MFFGERRQHKGKPMFNASLGDRVCRKPGHVTGRPKDATHDFSEAMEFAQGRAQQTGSRQRVIRSGNGRWWLSIMLEEEVKVKVS